MTVLEVKNYLKVEHDEEDVFIASLIGTADAYVKTHLEIVDETSELLSALPVIQAKYIIISYFYEDRDGVKGEIPSVVKDLLRPYRKVDF